MKTRLSGEFSVKQSDFGIEPFSMLAGAFSLKDEIRLEFLIVAREGS
ncbi:MAG: YceI family protein [Pseudomonadota bacterium]|nr:YceI family protein [Pseudomonadota bacterium]